MYKADFTLNTDTFENHAPFRLARVTSLHFISFPRVLHFMCHKIMWWQRCFSEGGKKCKKMVLLYKLSSWMWQKNPCCWYKGINCLLVFVKKITCKFLMYHHKTRNVKIHLYWKIINYIRSGYFHFQRSPLWIFLVNIIIIIYNLQR